MSGFRFSKRLRFGPLLVSLSRRGVSTSARVGPVTVNPARRRVSVNLLGPWSWVGRYGKRGDDA